MNARCSNPFGGSISLNATSKYSVLLNILTDNNQERDDSFFRYSYFVRKQDGVVGILSDFTNGVSEVIQELQDLVSYQYGGSFGGDPDRNSWLKLGLLFASGHLVIISPTKSERCFRKFDIIAHTGVKDFTFYRNGILTITTGGKLQANHQHDQDLQYLYHGGGIVTRLVRLSCVHHVILAEIYDQDLFRYVLIVRNNHEFGVKNFDLHSRITGGGSFEKKILITCDNGDIYQHQFIRRGVIKPESDISLYTKSHLLKLDDGCGEALIDRVLGDDVFSIDGGIAHLASGASLSMGGSMYKFHELPANSNLIGGRKSREFGILTDDGRFYTINTNDRLNLIPGKFQPL